MPTKDYNNCFNIQNRGGIHRRPWKSCHQIPYIKSYRSRILRMVAFHVSEQVFMIFKNETIFYMMIIIFVLLVSWNWMMMMMMNCFCGMVDRRKSFSFISSRDHCQRSSPSRTSDAPRAGGFEPAQNLSSGFVKWSCAAVITTTRRYYL